MNRSSALAVALALTAAVLAASPAFAQRGDRGNEEQPEVWKDMDVPAAPPLSPEQALKSFKVAPGFRVELVAAEPMIEDPVAMDWDAAGRLYVVEMRGYMPNVDGTGEDAPIGQVVRLEDTDGDGKMDERVVFLDGLVMPRAVAVLGDGAVLVGEPPNLWYCRDTDGDGRCDEKRVVYDRYGKQGPVEHTDNGLLQALDNWIYNAKSDERYRIVNGQALIEPTRFRGQWGIAQDNYGRLYYNSNSDYLRADLIPSEYLDRNPGFESGAGQGHRVVGDQSVHSIRVNPGVNRGYKSNTLREDGRLRSTTAVSGVTIYRGDQFGKEFVGDAFVPEPAGNVVAHFDIEDKDGTLRGTQSTYDDERWGKRAFLASTDERFRPVSAYNGPDGALYVVDMYRGILQHKVYVTSFLRKQIVERELDKPVGMGRIYRIVRDDRPIDRETEDLAELSTAKLARKLADANGQTRDMAQRILVARGDEAAVEPLREMMRSKSSPLAQIHAAWTLAALNGLNQNAVTEGLDDDVDPQVKIATLGAALPSALSGSWDSELFLGVGGPVFPLLGDRNDHVRLHAVAAAAQIAAHPRFGGDDALERLLTHGADALDHSGAARDLLLANLPGREFDLATLLIRSDDLKLEDSDRRSLLKSIAQIIGRSGRADAVVSLIELAKDAGKDERVAVLDGLTSWTKKPKAVRLAERPDALATLMKSDDKKTAELAAKLDSAWLVYGDAQVAGGPRPLTDAEQKLFDVGQQHYALICAACHQPHGKGLAGLAPTLVDSDWVTGDPEIATRIVLQGLMGPVVVNGEEWNLVMPGHALNPLFTDEVTAGVLTYIRRSWDNDAEPVTPDVVAKVRKATDGRVEPWTVEQLTGKEEEDAAGN